MKKATATIALAAALTISVAGCGEDKTTSPSSSGSPSAAATSGSGSSGASNGSAKAPGFDKPAKGGTVEGKTVSAALLSSITSARSYEETMSGSASDSVTAVVRAVKRADKRTDMTYSSNGKEGMRVVDNAIYARSSMSSSASTSWSRIDPKADEGMMARSLRLLCTIDGQPTGFTSAILDALQTTKVTYEGDDAKGAHYTATVPADEFMDKLSKIISVPGESGSLEKDKAKVNGKNVGYDIWVDGTGRPARIDVDGTVLETLDSTNSSSSPSAQMSVFVLSFSKWDQPFDVQAPPASQVHTITPGSPPSESGSSSGVASASS